jgi:hypothetical protein
MGEYLDEVRVLGNTDKYTIVKITTDKDTYTARLPYTKMQRDNREDVYHYSISIRDWCRLRDIIVKDYFSFKLQRLIDS